MTSCPSSIHVVHVVYAFGTGGMEKGIATIISGCPPGFQHTVLCLKATGESQRLLPKDTPVLSLEKPPGHSFRFIKTLASVLRSLQPNVIHTRNWSGMDGIIASKFAGIRNVVHGEHGWDMIDPCGRSRKRILFRRIMSRWVKEYTCVSIQNQDWLRKTIKVKKPVTQIYNGIDTKAYSPGNGTIVRSRIGIQQDAFVVGTVGRLDPIKDQVTLIRAFRRFQKRRPESRLLIVGDGPERGNLEAQAGNGVLFLGNRMDVPELLRAMDIFVLPSINEGISNTLLETMATELPIVATRVGGNPEVIQDGITGCLVPVGNVVRLNDALEAYAASPALCERHGRSGRERALRSFNVRSMALGYHEVYRRVAAVG